MKSSVIKSNYESYLCIVQSVNNAVLWCLNSEAYLQTHQNISFVKSNCLQRIICRQNTTHLQACMIKQLQYLKYIFMEDFISAIPTWNAIYWCYFTKCPCYCYSVMYLYWGQACIIMQYVQNFQNFHLFSTWSSCVDEGNNNREQWVFNVHYGWGM